MSQTVNIRIPKNVRWSPQKDISAYELALALPTLVRMATGIGHGFVEDEVEALPDTVNRHFTVTDHPVFK